jgi:hypothetical protein
VQRLGVAAAAAAHLQDPDGFIHIAAKCQVVDGCMLHNALLVNDEQATQGNALICVGNKTASRHTDRKMAQHSAPNRRLHALQAKMGYSLDAKCAILWLRCVSCCTLLLFVLHKHIRQSQRSGTPL